MFLSGVALFVDGLIPWWYRVATEAGTFSYGAGLTGWSLAAVIAGAVAALLVLVRAAVWPEPAPSTDGIVYAVLGLIAVAATGIEIARTDAEWIGMFVGLAIAVVLAVAGVRRRRERAAGWI